MKRIINMATRSLVFIKDNDDKKYKGTYIHFDGYIDWVGKILLENYNDNKSLKELINASNGAISALKPTLSETLNENHINDQEGIIELEELDYRKLQDNYMVEFIYIYEDNIYYVVDLVNDDPLEKQELQPLYNKLLEQE